MTQKAGFKFFFKKVEPLAKIEVSYHIAPDEIIIWMDLREFSRLKNQAKLYILNEQGANFFPQYKDSSGSFLKGEEIGVWDRVMADQAYFISSDGSICFGLKNPQLADISLYRGWELLPNSLAWAGLIFDLSCFAESTFNYSILIA